MPYRTLDDRIDGVVITFADITVAKTLEAKLREKQAVLEERRRQSADGKSQFEAGANANKRTAKCLKSDRKT